ncbi:uncharacterized protein LOC135953518 [Calliphora vicina]|uniref:uncharacterized protein LOC135953518 n=1 Tax=Calliphora vicina TaxID=7373 RepID=UPI00325BF59E
MTALHAILNILHERFEGMVNSRGASECGLSTFYHRKTTNTTEQPESTTATTSDRLSPAYYKSNNIPEVDEGCSIFYVCRQKLRTVEIPKPCIKFCVKNIECDNGKITNGAPGQCVELNEEMVSHEYKDELEGTTNPQNLQAAMILIEINFPCQPGYLPDSRSRCREVW